MDHGILASVDEMATFCGARRGASLNRVVGSSVRRGVGRQHVSMGHLPLCSPAASSARNHAPPTPNHRPNQTKPEAGELFFQNLPPPSHHTCHQRLHPLFSLSRLPNALPPTVLIASTSIYILFLLLSHLIPGASCAPLPLDPSSSSPSRLPSPSEQRHQPLCCFPRRRPLLSNQPPQSHLEHRPEWQL